MTDAARIALSIDASKSSSGLALVRLGPAGPPEALRTDARGFTGALGSWFAQAVAGARALCDGVCDPSEPIWLIEEWERHRNHNTAVVLARAQQTWVCAGAALGARTALVPVLGWQVPTGVNRVNDKRDGKDARKLAAVRWAVATYGLARAPGFDVADALCMAAVWLAERRAKSAVLDL